MEVCAQRTPLVIPANLLPLIPSLIPKNTLKNMTKPLVVICRDSDFEGGPSDEEMKMFIRARIREFPSKPHVMSLTLLSIYLHHIHTHIVNQAGRMASIHTYGTFKARPLSLPPIHNQPFILLNWSSLGFSDKSSSLGSVGSHHQSSS